MTTENKTIKKWLSQGLTINDCIKLTSEQLKGLNACSEKWEKISDLHIECKRIRKELKK